MKKLLLVILVFWASKVSATEYFVDASTGSSMQNGTLANPWKTIAQVNSKMSIFLPGDVIRFKSGGTYVGTLAISKSGSASAPLYFKSYGTGARPIFSGSGRALITIYGRNYITIDSLNLTDLNMDPNDRYKQANLEVGIDAEGTNLVVQNCQMSLIGAGVNLSGSYSCISANLISNLRMIKNTPTSENDDDDYGANPVIISGAYDTVINNIFAGCWAYSYDYGYDGGAVEFYGSGTHGNVIMYNRASDCDGFMEFGSGNGGTSINNLVAYNLVINCGGLVYVNGSGQYAIAVTNLQMFNNILVETKVNFAGADAMVIFNSSSSATMKNNVFNLSGGIDVARTTNNLIHKNNVYKLSAGSSTNFTIDSSERSTNQPVFVNTFSTDPVQWDYRPIMPGASQNAGQWVGITRDIMGTPVAQVPDAGIYEYLTTTAIGSNPPVVVTPQSPSVWNDQNRISIRSDRMDNWGVFNKWILYDMAGARLDAGSYRRGTTTINISQLPHGAYALKTEFKTYKIIK